MTEPALDPNAVRSYYGTELKTNQDLKTDACCTGEDLSPTLKRIFAELEDEILARFYGCGSPLPPALEGQTVLDMGCGTGRDAYTAAKLAGPNGHVIGVDMTPEQLEVAERYREPQMKKFGLDPDAIEFKLGPMEDLAALGIADHSVDVVISNCVLNLSADKPKVFSEIFRVLKPGGELFFSDVFADRRIPEELKSDPVLHGECLAGAMYREDFRRLLAEVGCKDARILTTRPLVIGDPAIEALIGMIPFHAETVRAFALPNLEDRCEDYGQTATYLGTIPDAPHRFDLDDHHCFQTGKPMLVCGNSADMISKTRYRHHFEVTGDRSVHFGLFDCEAVAPSSAPVSSGSGCC